MDQPNIFAASPPSFGEDEEMQPAGGGEEKTEPQHSHAVAVEVEQVELRSPAEGEITPTSRPTTKDPDEPAPQPPTLFQATNRAAAMQKPQAFAQQVAVTAAASGSEAKAQAQQNAARAQANAQAHAAAAQDSGAEMKQRMQSEMESARASAEAALQHERERLRKAQEELQRGQEELKRKEQELQSRIVQIGNVAIKPPNWPKRFLCISPQVYHNIAEEVPVDRQRFVTSMYVNYYLTCAILFYQTITTIVVLASDSKKNDDGEDTDDNPWTSHFAVSLLYLSGIFFAFITWYWPIYKAVSTRSLSRYRIAFVGLIVAWAFSVFMLLGTMGHGGTGIIYTITIMDKKESSGPGIMALVGAGLWAMQAIFLFQRGYVLRRYYHEDDNPRARLEEKGQAIATLGGLR